MRFKDVYRRCTSDFGYKYNIISLNIYITIICFDTLRRGMMIMIMNLILL